MVIGERLAEKRALILDLYERYKRQKELFLKNFDNEDDGVDDKLLKSMINSIKSQKFTVAVAGEVKAGKSTFINALLGEEILPTDILQATSAVIEILKSDTIFLKIEFADGHTEEFTTTDINEIKEKLNTFCKLSDEYRSIPTPLIENIIINSEEELIVDDTSIEVLEKKSQKYKFKNLKDKKDLIIKFIKERPKSKIPREVKIGYPVPWTIDEIRICDTPGVHAIGGLEDRTHKILEEANAILFIHPIRPLESKFFYDLVEKQLSKKGKENVFLIFTQLGKETNREEKIRALETAKDYYKELIKEDRIFAVDSIIKLIYEKIKRQNFKINEEVYKIMKKSLRGDVVEEIEEMIKKQDFDGLLAYSGFKEFYQELDQFLSIAPYNLLLDVVKKIKEGYENQYKSYESEINFHKKELKKPPQEFYKELNEIMNDLDLLENKYKVVLENLRQESIPEKITDYTTECNKMSKIYESKINGSTEYEEIRKHVYDFISEINESINNLYKEVMNIISEKIKIELDKFHKDTGIYITQIDMDKINKEAKEKGYIKVIEYEDRPWDFWDKITLGLARLIRENKIKKERVVFDSKEYLKILKNKCIIEIQTIRENQLMYDNLMEPVNEILDNIKIEIDEKIRRKKEALIEIEKKLKDAEEIQKKIEYFEEIKKEIQDNLLNCDQIKEGIEWLLK